MNWQPIATAPKDGTEILVCDQYDTVLARWIAPSEFLTEEECQSLGDIKDDPDWFFADFVHGGRLDWFPLLWMPVPQPPSPCLPLPSTPNT